MTTLARLFHHTAIKELKAVSGPKHEVSLRLSMIRGIMALHDLLSGPPMTDRQRLWRDIAEALPGRRMGPRGL